MKLDGHLADLRWRELLPRLASPDPTENLGSLVSDREFRLLSENKGGPCPVTWETPFGAMGSRHEGRIHLRHQLLHSWYGPEPLHPVPPAPQVREGDIVLEIGAWVGTFTRYALNRGALRVVALEPEPVNSACFQQNFEREIEEGRVVLIQAAAWDSSGTVRMANIGHWNAEKSGKGYGVTEEGPLEVEAVTVDEVVEQLKLERVDFMNLDIEGGERHAIAGARETMKRFRPTIVMCIHHLPDDAGVLPRLVREIEPAYVLATTPLQGYFTIPSASGP